MNISRTVTRFALIASAIIFVGVSTVTPAFAQTQTPNMADEARMVDRTYRNMSHTSSGTVYRKADFGLADQVGKHGAADVRGRKFVCSFDGWYLAQITARVQNRDTVNTGWVMGVWVRIANVAKQRPQWIPSTTRAENLRIRTVQFCKAGESIEAGISVRDAYKFRIRLTNVIIKRVGGTINP